MKAITGREIISDMMQLGISIARWNKQYTSREKVAKRMEERGLTHHQLDFGFHEGESGTEYCFRNRSGIIYQQRQPVSDADQTADSWFYPENIRQRRG